jgi:plastocyanin
MRLNEKPPKVWGAILVLGLTVAIAGCGSSSSSSTSTSSTSSSATTQETSSSGSSTNAAEPTSGAAAQKLQIAANAEGQLKYEQKTLTAKAGAVVIDFTNSAPLGHNVTIESSSHKLLGATPTFQGGSKTVSLNLKPGTYKFFCSVPGHRMAGMEGTLVVK